MPQEGGKGVRVRSMPTIRDRGGQGAFKLILDPICEADCPPGSDGYRPKRSAHDAVGRVAEAMVKYKARVIDGAWQASFDHIRHDLWLAKVAQRVNDPDGLQGLKLLLQAAGTKGVAPGGVLSPLLRNLYLPAGDRMLERAQEVTRRGSSPSLASARCADALVIVVDASPPHDGLLKAVETRLREARATLQVASKEDKSRTGDLARGEPWSGLGFACRRVRSRRGAGRAWYPPLLQQRTALLRKLKDILQR